MKYAYPAIFTLLDNGEYDVRVPDLPGCHTCGKNLVDAISMIEDAAAMWLWDAENNSEAIPPATSLVATSENQFVSYIVADVDEYRKKYDSRAVKKTLTIPAWMNAQAEREGVNFSQVLQDGLKRILDSQH